MKDPSDIIEEAQQLNKEISEQAREALQVFLGIDGMLPRSEAVSRVSAELSVGEGRANRIISSLVSDLVDPVQQIKVDREKYVGVIDYKEFNISYGYVDYNNRLGKRKRVVCAKCVEENRLDENVRHATEGQGSSPENASWDGLVARVRTHFKQAHSEEPSEIEPGASLVSGTTIGGSESWHAGNDGAGSGLDADNIRGTDASTFASNAAPVQSVNSKTGDVEVSGISIESETFTSNGTWTKPDGAKFVYVHLVAGGGAGREYDFGGGGGAGYATIVNSEALPSEVNITVGSGGEATGEQGSIEDGGDSSFGSLYVNGGVPAQGGNALGVEDEGTSRRVYSGGENGAIDSIYGGGSGEPSGGNSIYGGGGGPGGNSLLAGDGGFSSSGEFPGGGGGQGYSGADGVVYVKTIIV